MEQTISESHPFQCPHCGLHSTVFVHTHTSLDTEVTVKAGPVNRSYTEDVAEINGTPALREQVDLWVHKETE